MLYVAYLDARKNKRNSESQLEFELNLEKNLRDLRDELYNRVYELQPSICFIINYPSKREIFVPTFRDRVITHFIYNILYPMVDPLFINDSFSCRIGKGTLYGVKRFHHMLRSSTNNFTRKNYVLSLDISGYFMNINKDILKKAILNMLHSRKNKFDIDYELLEYLICKTIDYDPILNCKILGHLRDWEGLPNHKSLFHVQKHKGLPIGALTSLLYSNIYLNILDQYVKRTFKIKYYCRYVDDAKIIGNSYEELQLVSIKIKKFLKETLDLDLNMLKTTIISTYKRQTFLGAVIINHKLYCVKRTLQNFAFRIRYMDYLSAVEAMNLINSYLGYLSYFKSDKVVRGVLKNPSIVLLFNISKDFKKVTIKYEKI